mgnify:CR=1 FL=1
MTIIVSIEDIYDEAFICSTSIAPCYQVLAHSLLSRMLRSL